MSQLAELQRQFAGALRDPDHPLPPCTGQFNGRFDAYRNNMMVNTIEALQVSYPATRQLVGDDYFRVVARAYIQAHPPRNPVLLQYGERFGDFIAHFPSASKVPYLGDVARLEWSCVQALHAADTGVVGISALGEVAEPLMDKVTLSLHPSLGLVRSRWPVISLRAASLANCHNVEDDAMEVDMKKPQRGMVIRPYMEVNVHEMPLQHWLFVDALQKGMTIGESAELVIQSVEEFDLPSVLGGIFQVGAVATINVPQ